MTTYNRSNEEGVEYYIDDVLREQHDHGTRIVATWNAQGAPTGTRPYTAEENAMADEAARQAEVTAENLARDAQNQAILAAVAATTTPKTGGGAWVQPTGVTDAYALEAEVTHGGKSWLSLVDYNVWEPGVSGWREQVSEGYPAWIQPTGAHDAYPLGAKVQHNGQNWENTGSAANTWEPGVFGWIVIP